MHFYLLRRQWHAAAAFRDTPGNTDLGLHAVEGVEEYLAGLHHPSCADFERCTGVLGADCRETVAGTEVGAA